MPDYPSATAIAQRLLNLMIRLCVNPGAVPQDRFAVSDQSLVAFFDYLLHGLDLATDNQKAERLLQLWERNFDLFRANFLNLLRQEPGTMFMIDGTSMRVMTEQKSHQVLGMCPPIDL